MCIVQNSWKGKSVLNDVLQAVLTTIQTAFGFLTDFQLFGIPVLYIFIGVAVVGLVLNFIKGERK